MLFDRLTNNPALGVAVTQGVVEWGMLIGAQALVPGGLIDRRDALHYAKLAFAFGAGLAVVEVGRPLTDSAFGVAGVAGMATYVLIAALLRAHTKQEIETAVRWLIGRASGSGTNAMGGDRGGRSRWRTQHGRA